MIRTHYSKEISPKLDSKEVVVMGWVRAIRGSSKLRFIQLADKEGYVQIIVKNPSGDLLNKMESLGREYVISVKGKVQKNKQAPNGIEIIPSKIEILNESERLPMEVITKKTPADVPTRLNSRYIDLRRPEIASIFKIKSEVVTAFRDFFDKKGFIEVHTPKLMSSPSESGSNVFEVKYFNTKAYLAQSPQFYKQLMMVSGFEKVYEIAPVFRAEKHHTYRHVTEYTSMDFEMSFIENYEDLMKIIEKLFVHIYKHVSKNCKNELDILGKEVKIPKLPFPRVTMKQAHDMLEKSGYKVDRNSDLDSEGEKIFSELVQKKFKHDFVFLTEFPWSVRPFYHMKSGEMTTNSSDMLCKGLEIATLAQREHKYDILMKQLKEKGLTEKSLKHYLDSFKYGVPPHGGAGIGLDRIVMKLLDLPNIREAVLFPRDPDRLYP